MGEALMNLQLHECRDRELIISTVLSRTRSADMMNNNVNFTFFCKSVYHVWVASDHFNQFVVAVEPLGVIGATTHVNFWNPYEAHTRITEALKNCPMSDSMLQELIRFSSSTALDLLPRCNPLDLEIHFTVIHTHFLDELAIRRALEMELGTLSSSPSSGIVPAADSSIQCLKKKIMNDEDCEEGHNSCSICLEDFCVGSECLCLPCSHMFHGECISKWLKKSHYCPLYRFQMPTASS